MRIISEHDVAPQFCSSCSLADRCLPAGLDVDEVRRFEQIVLRQKPVERRQYLYRKGDPFQGLIAVRSGCLKSTSVDSEGREHVQNFHFPGEVIGFDAVYLGKQMSTAIALVDSAVCYLSFWDIMRSAEEMPRFQIRLFRLFSHYALRSGCLTGDFTAEERVAAFLLSIASRLPEPGEFKVDLELAMSREDIANHLRLASETVSRVLRKFRDERLIAVQGKHIELLDLGALKALGAPLTELLTG